MNGRIKKAKSARCDIVIVFTSFCEPIDERIRNFPKFYNVVIHMTTTISIQAAIQACSASYGASLPSINSHEVSSRFKKKWNTCVSLFFA